MDGNRTYMLKHLLEMRPSMLIRASKVRQTRCRRRPTLRWGPRREHSSLKLALLVHRSRLGPKRVLAKINRQIWRLT